MIAERQPRLFTPQEYLLVERQACEKSEYLDGHIYAMAGGSRNHAAITQSVGTEIGYQLKGKPCASFSGDLRIATDDEGLFAYPDLTIVCGREQFRDSRRDVLRNPTIVIEVLSPSTASYDLNAKYQKYIMLASLKEVIFIRQDTPQIERRYRRTDGSWGIEIATGLSAELYLEAIDCHLRLADVYEKVDFSLEEQDGGRD